VLRKVINWFKNPHIGKIRLKLTVRGTDYAEARKRKLRRQRGIFDNFETGEEWYENPRYK